MQVALGRNLHYLSIGVFLSNPHVVKTPATVQYEWSIVVSIAKLMQKYNEYRV
jgi:hypothetical protein